MLGTQQQQLRGQWPGASCSSRSPAPTPHRPHHHRRSVRSPSTKDGGPPSGGPESSEGGPGKADFSAYWSLKIKQMFENRRKYLEDIDRKGIPESELARKAHERAEQNAAQLEAMQEEARQIKRLKLQARRQLQEQGQPLGPDGMFVPMSPAQAGEETERDIQAARDSLRSAAVSSVALNMHRASQLIRAVLLSPLKLAKSIQQQWSGLYTSQRYENFLMAEGERIWYWRNRTENERWFWEIIVWERLLLPILCTISYELLVPNHLFWAIVVPLTFIFMQSGELPSPRSLEFWLLAYFGFYRKCWPDVAASLRAVVGV